MDIQVSRAQGCAGATQLKTPYWDGTTHVIFQPLDFIAWLAALVPKPRVNLTRFHGVFAPNGKHHALVTPAKRGKGAKPQVFGEGQEKTPVEHRASMAGFLFLQKPAYMPSMAITWAQRLKRVFNIDIATCETCGGALRIIACIEDPVVIKRIPSFGP